jgi:hypothetical protein
MDDRRETTTSSSKSTPVDPPQASETAPAEIGGPKGPEPTRYGDWEVGGRCTDF